MTNGELWEQYSNFAIDLSNNARKLAFAGAAIVWLFKTNENIFPPAALFALLFIIVFFVLDIMQYFLGAIILKRWLENEESKKVEETGTIEGKYDKPRYVDYPSYACWMLKVIALLISYGFLWVQIFS